jgi:hypothetical protein
MESRRSRMVIFAVVLIAMVAVVLFQTNSILAALGGLRH